MTCKADNVAPFVPPATVTYNQQNHLLAMMSAPRLFAVKFSIFFTDAEQKLSEEEKRSPLTLPDPNSKLDEETESTDAILRAKASFGVVPGQKKNSALQITALKRPDSLGA